MRYTFLACVAIAGCGSRIDRALSLIDDAAYVEARIALARERCGGSNDTPQCALAQALVADGLGDRQSRDAWTALAGSRSRTTRLSDVENARLMALVRRVAWDREVDHLAALKAGRGTTD
jgi:hypothetical protein